MYRYVSLFAFVLCGCATQINVPIGEQCGFEIADGWSQLRKAPPERADLLALIARDTIYAQIARQRSDGLRRWFVHSDSKKLGYCYLPEFPSACGGYTAIFSR